MRSIKKWRKKQLSSLLPFSAVLRFILCVFGTAHSMRNTFHRLHLNRSRGFRMMPEWILLVTKNQFSWIPNVTPATAVTPSRAGCLIRDSISPATPFVYSGRACDKRYRNWGLQWLSSQNCTCILVSAYFQNPSGLHRTQERNVIAKPLIACSQSPPGYFIRPWPHLRHSHDPCEIRTAPPSSLRFPCSLASQRKLESMKKRRECSSKSPSSLALPLHSFAVHTWTKVQ